MKFAEIRAVVSGGASGLGRSVVERVIAAGGRAAILDLDGPSAGEAVAGSGAVFLACDVGAESQVDAAMQAAHAALGGIDLLVNCAGVLGGGRLLGREGPMSGAFFERVLRVNLLGTFLCDKAAAACMRVNEPNDSGERGVIVHTSSIAAFEGQIGQVAYAASKAAVAGMTLPVARELASFGIRCVTIAPGLFMTPMLAALAPEARASLGSQIPFPARLGRAEEFAALVQAIVEIPTLNGEVLRLDGALRMQPR